MKVLFCIVLALFLANDLYAKPQVGKQYSMADYKKDLSKKDKNGRTVRPEYPCPCLWNKKRGRGKDFKPLDGGIQWECKKWRSNGQCESIGSVGNKTDADRKESAKRMQRYLETAKKQEAEKKAEEAKRKREAKRKKAQDAELNAVHKRVQAESKRSGKKIYSLKDFKDSGKLGERASVPCPCVWNKARGRGEEFRVPDGDVQWECKIWNSDGKCDGIGTVQGQ